LGNRYPARRFEGFSPLDCAIGASKETRFVPNFINLPSFTEDGDVLVVVETPRGSRAKFAYDPKMRAFTLSKSLLTGLTYPHDWGFVPSTKADDGDPIDIMVIHDAATFPGLVLTCRVIGVQGDPRPAPAP
jgi:inorganic pyrophosphatase